MSELLAYGRYSVVGTSLAPLDVEMAQTRAAAVRLKAADAEIQFLVCPMETVHETLGESRFDAAFVFEALHHAYYWRKTL